MNKSNTSHVDPEERKAVDTAGLMAMLGTGKQTACKIGEAAGAKVVIGKRVIWNLAKIQEYLDKVSTGAE